MCLQKLVNEKLPVRIHYKLFNFTRNNCIDLKFKIV